MWYKRNRAILSAKESRMLLLVIFSLLLSAIADVSESSICSVKAVYKQSSKLTPQYLNCSIERGSQASVISWKVEGQIVKQASGLARWLVVSLNSTALRHVDDLRCEVMVGNTRHSCGFVQDAPPRIVSQLYEYEPLVGTPLVIPCRATGSPQPDIIWMKNLTKDMPRSVKQIKSRDTLTLVFKRVSMMHKGVYTCYATNPLGRDRYFVFVNPHYYSILRPPRVVPRHPVITVSKGSSAVLVCLAKHTPLRYTLPFWVHRGATLTNTTRYHMKSRYSERIVRKKYTDQRTKMSLTISHVTSKDGGVYTCGVVTHVGRQESHVELRIKE